MLSHTDDELNFGVFEKKFAPFCGISSVSDCVCIRLDRIVVYLTDAQVLERPHEESTALLVHKKSNAVEHINKSKLIPSVYTFELGLGH